MAALRRGKRRAWSSWSPLAPQRCEISLGCTRASFKTQKNSNEPVNLLWKICQLVSFCRAISWLLSSSGLSLGQAYFMGGGSRSVQCFFCSFLSILPEISGNHIRSSASNTAFWEAVCTMFGPMSWSMWGTGSEEPPVTPLEDAV